MDAQRQCALCLVLSAVLCDYTGVGMMRVTLPFYAKVLDNSGALIAGVETAYGVGQVAGALVLPKLSDSWGRRRVLMVSFAGSALGYGLAILARWARSPALLLLSRVPVGLAKQTVTVSRAVVADCTGPGHERSHWMSLLGTAIAAGYSLGPFLGGQLAERASAGAPAIAATAIFAMLFPVLAVGLPETLPARPVPAASDGGQREAPLWQCPRILAVLAALALPELGLVAHTSVTLYTFCMQVLGKGYTWLGNLTSATAVVQALLAATLLPALTGRGWSDVALLHCGIGSFAAASLVIAIGQSEGAVMLSAVPASLAIAVLRSYPATLLSKRVPGHRQGEAMGLQDLCSSGLRVFAPILASLLMRNLGAASVFYGQALLFAAASLALAVLLPPDAGVKRE